MSNFMRYDVGFREIAASAKAVLKFTEKPEVDVHASIFWTIERPGCAAGKAATGLSPVCKEHQLRFLVFATHLTKDLVPRVFGIGENDSNEYRCVIPRRLAVVLRSLR